MSRLLVIAVGLSWSILSPAAFEGEVGLASMRGHPHEANDRGRLRLNGKLKHPLPFSVEATESTLILDGGFRYQTPDNDKSRTKGLRGELEEASLGIAGDRFVTKLGWQVLRWGEMLGPSLLDVASPRDLEDPVQFVKSDKKLASPMALVTIIGGDLGRLELFYTPQDARPKTTRRLGPYVIHREDAETLPSYGGRWLHALLGFSFNLFVLDHPARIPSFVPDLSAAEPSLEARYPAMRSGGGGAAYAFDQVVLRSEVLHTQAKVRGVGPGDQQRAVALAADFSHESTLIGLQSHHLRALGRGEDEAHEETWAGVYGSHAIEALALSFSAMSYRRLGAQDSLERVQVQYDLSDATSFSLSGELFRGDKDPIMTLLDQEDLVVGELRVKF